MKVRACGLGTLILIAVLSGCVSTTKSGNLRQSIGDFAIAPIHPQRSVDLYAKVREDDNGPWTLVSLGEQRPRVRVGEEVIGIDLRRNVIGPAYEVWGHTNADAAGFFECSPLMRDEKTNYHPCGSTRLTKTNAAGSTMKNIAAAVTTLGLAAGSRKDVDAAELARLADQTQLLATISRHQAATSLYQTVRQLYPDAQRAVQKRYAPEIVLIDESGLSTLSARDIGPIGRFRFPELPAFAWQHNDPSVLERLDISRAYLLNLRDGFPRTTPPPSWLTEVMFKCNQDPDVREKGHTLSIDCENQTYPIEQLASPRATVTVKGRDAVIPFPPYQSSDDRLVVEVEEGGRLVLTNLTDEFLTIESIAVYWNEHVVTVERGRRLSPQSN